MKYTLLLFCTFLIISCGTQQKAVENMQKENTTPPANSAIIDSVNAQHDKIAESDALNTTKTIKGTTDGYITDDGETVTTEVIPNNEEKEVFSHTIWNNLLQKHVSKEGVVDYKGFKKDHKELKKYIILLSGDDEDSGNNVSKEEKLAFWINAYNALTIDLILRNYPLKSIKDIKKPWDQRLWMIGYLWYNLNDIEHKILRKMNEPRIHFAINCASFSCPPLLNEAFTAEKLEQQLTQVTKVFLADSQRNTITANKIEISKIFKWFSKDFKQNGSLIDFLNQYSDVKINKNAKKSYKDYNWNLNE